MADRSRANSASKNTVYDKNVRSRSKRGTSSEKTPSSNVSTSNANTSNLQDANKSPSFNNSKPIVNANSAKKAQNLPFNFGGSPPADRAFKTLYRQEMDSKMSNPLEKYRRVNATAVSPQIHEVTSHKTPIRKSSGISSNISRQSKKGSPQIMSPRESSTAETSKVVGQTQNRKDESDVRETASRVADSRNSQGSTLQEEDIKPVLREDRSKEIERSADNNASPSIRASAEKRKSNDAVQFGSENLNIPLNMNVLKQKLRDSDKKNPPKNTEEESTPNNKADNHFFSFGRGLVKEKSRYDENSEKNRSDVTSPNPKRSEEGSQSNWLYKKFAEAALAKKDGMKGRIPQVLNRSSQDEILAKENPLHTMSPEQSVKFQKKVNSRSSSKQYKTNDTHNENIGVATPSQNSRSTRGIDNTQFNTVLRAMDQVEGFTAVDMNTMLNIVRPNVTFLDNGQGPSLAEYQRNMLCVINFYEQHLSNFKGLIIQQNKIVNAQSQKMKTLNQLLEELNNKNNALHLELKNQEEKYQNEYKDLVLKFKETAKECRSSKTTLETTLKKLEGLILINNSTFKEKSRPPSKDFQSSEAYLSICQDLQLMRDDLEKQKEAIMDIANRTCNLQQDFKQREEQQYSFRDRNMSHSPPEAESKREATSRWRTNRNTSRENIDAELNTSEKNKIKEVEPEDLYLTPSKNDYYPPQQRKRLVSASVPKLKPHSQYDVNSSRDEFRDGRESKDRTVDNVLNNSQSQENKILMMQNKQNMQASKVKDLLSWDTTSRTRDHSVNSQNNNYNNNSNIKVENVDEEPRYRARRTVFNHMISDAYSIKDDSDSFDNLKTRAFSTEQKQPRAHENPMWSGRKDDSMMRDIDEIELRINELSSQKKMIENEIFKMPSTSKNPEQKRRRTALELEFENIENKLEVFKSKMRSINSLKSRRIFS